MELIKNPLILKSCHLIETNVNERVLYRVLNFEGSGFNLMTLN